ncbi:hypothetical protein AAD001_17945 [Colwelliaceae bacterium 6471]
MKLSSILLLFLPWQTLANVEFKNCEPKVCESLYENLVKGIPVFASQINTGKVFTLKENEITSIEQIGSDFMVGVNKRTFHHVSFKCFSNTPCLFVSTRGITTVTVD